MLQDYCQTNQATRIKQALGVNRMNRMGTGFEENWPNLCNNQAKG